jgi:hypothetical protein
VEHVLCKFSDFIADAIGDKEQGISMEDPYRGCDVDLFEAKEVLRKKDVVLGYKMLQMAHFSLK